MSGGVRLDKWLWAARFFKTRTLAKTAIEGGKVRVAGARAKPGREVRVGQRLEVRVGLNRYEITIMDLSEKRGPASVARTLYQESDESAARREREAAERKAAARAAPDYGGRPTKYQRRRIQKLLQKNQERFPQ